MTYACTPYQHSVKRYTPVERYQQRRPDTDIYSDDHGYNLHIALPGVQPSDVKLQVKNNQLVLEAETSITQPSEAEAVRREVFTGNWQRRFVIPQDVDSDGIAAKHDNGLLLVQLPKRASARSKTIPIE